MGPKIGAHGRDDEEKKEEFDEAEKQKKTEGERDQ